MYEPVIQTKTNGFQPDELAQKKEYDWPILFYGVIGQDKTVSVNNASSINSWSNAEEAEAIVDIVAKLTSKGVHFNEIGVMSPFRGQVVLIRRLLRAKLLGAVDVGTIEDYQSVKRNVIVLSLTRSSPDFVPNDKLRRVGVFGQPKGRMLPLLDPKTC
jgi:superfamily I DNA and/or RNA helicase